MNILSIDVGMKHLAICIIHKDLHCLTHSILAWDVINLCSDQNKNNCGFLLKTQTICNKKAKYQGGAKYYCKIHAKKADVPLPPSLLTTKKLKKMKVSELKILTLFKNNNLAINTKKTDIIDCLVLDLSNNYLHPIENVDCRSVNFITYGQAVKCCFDKVLNTYDIDCVIIENQIGPLALRMKMLQGMIMQYFIDNNILNIKEVSPANKLKGYTLPNKKTTYNERKKLGIKITRELITTNHMIEEWVPFFDKHLKKDDLADAYLQVLWFINQKNK
tara:strand:+ start:682 stop:1506 length:825 start_codon:yes stop_codon:yes gene_type:complete